MIKNVPVFKIIGPLLITQSVIASARAPEFIAPELIAPEFESPRFEISKFVSQELESPAFLQPLDATHSSAATSTTATFTTNRPDDLSLITTDHDTAGFFDNSELDRLTSKNSVAKYGNTSDNVWQVSGDMGLVYSSQREMIPNKHALDVAEYRTKGQHQKTQLTLWQKNTEPTSLAMERSYQKGASASIGFESINSSVTSFILDTEGSNGFRYGRGINDAKNIVHGIVWEHQPVSRNPELLYVSATYLTAGSNATGTSPGAIQNEQKGETWSVVADSSVLDKQLRFRAEMATSNSDIITTKSKDIGLIDARGNAVAFLATFTPQVNESNKSLIWSSGFEYSEVDTLFNSIANTKLPKDKKRQRLFLNADWSGLNAQISTAKETDNVNNDVTRPEILTKHNQFLLRYNLSHLLRQNNFFDVVGLPSLSFQWGKTIQEQIRPVNGKKLADGFYTENDVYRIGAGFNKARWSWGVSFSDSDKKDKIDFAKSLTSRGSNIHASFQLNRYFTLTPSIETNNTKFSGDNGNADIDIYSVIAQLSLTDRLSGEFKLNQSSSSSDSTFSPIDTETSEISFQFNWNWILPNNNKPGFDIGLSGTYLDADNKLKPADNLTAYQVFLNLVMSLPVSFAR